MSKSATKKLSERMYEVIRRPVVTEKSMRVSANGHVTFIVPMDATKPEIKEAVEALFKVKVVSVNTINQVGKEKRFRGRLGQRSDYKKAVVRLAEGQNIDVTTGI